MSVLSPEDRSAIVERAMRRKFGHLLEWVRPTLLHTFGPNDLAAVEKYEAKLEDTKKKMLETLSGWSDEKIQDLGTHLKDVSRIEEDEWDSLAASAIDELSRHPPKPIAYGFGHPSFEADFAYWGKMPELTIHEVLALSVGADPAAFTEDRLNDLLEFQAKGGKPWAALNFLAKRYEIFRRHFRN